MIRVVHPGSDPDILPIPDPGSRGQKGTRSRIRIHNTALSELFYKKTEQIKENTTIDVTYGTGIQQLFPFFWMDFLRWVLPGTELLFKFSEQFRILPQPLFKNYHCFSSTAFSGGAPAWVRWALVAAAGARAQAGRGLTGSGIPPHVHRLT